VLPLIKKKKKKKDELFCVCDRNPKMRPEEEEE
jgi:hypothetical protein